MNRRTILAVAGVACCIWPSAAHAEAPVADAQVSEASPATNFGSASRLRVDGSPVVRSYLRFDITGAGSPITRATLRLYPTSSLSSGLGVRPVTDDAWQENTITFANAPAIGAVSASSGPLTSGTPVDIDVTSLATGDSDGLLSLALTGASSTALALGSREDPTRAPELQIETGSAAPDPLPIADSYVSETSSATNFGALDRLRADGSPLLRAYLRFDIAGLTEPVARATLRLHPTSSLNAGIGVRPVANDGWQENTITFANAPPVGALGATSGPLASGSPVDIDVTALVAAEGDGQLTLALTTTSSTAIALGSREDASRSPRLDIETGTGSDPVIAAAGDIACNPAAPSYNGGAGTATACRQRATSDLLLAEPLDAVLALGDLQYENGELANFQVSYDSSWGRVKGITKPVPGNHEYLTTGASGYYDYFNGAGVADGPAGNRSEGWYSFDLGDWHVVALNSNCTDVSCVEGSPQEQWLENDLAAHPTECTLAFWHHPRYSSGDHQSLTFTSALWRTLQDAGADLVLTGHDHDYERFAPQDADGAADPEGMRQFVVGTGGKSLRAFGAIAPNSAFRNAQTFGVLRLELHPTGYEWGLVPAGGGAAIDPGSASCN